MGRLDTSKAAELRVLAEKLRRRAGEMTAASYVEMMRHAADDLDAEAMMLDADVPVPPGRHLNIVV